MRVYPGHRPRNKPSSPEEAPRRSPSMRGPGVYTPPVPHGGASSPWAGSGPHPQLGLTPNWAPGPGAGATKDPPPPPARPRAPRRCPLSAGLPPRPPPSPRPPPPLPHPPLPPSPSLPAAPGGPAAGVAGPRLPRPAIPRTGGPAVHPPPAPFPPASPPAPAPAPGPGAEGTPRTRACTAEAGQHAAGPVARG